MKQTPLIIYPEWAELISNLDDEAAGQLIKAICNKRLDKEIYIEDKTIKAIFLGIFEGRLETDEENYKETCEKRRQAINKRWGDYNEKNTNVYKSIQENTNVYKSIQENSDVIQMNYKNNNKNKNNNNYIYNNSNSYKNYKHGNYDFEALERETKGERHDDNEGTGS